MIASVTYDPDAGTLDITFQSGRTYTYDSVPVDVAEGFVSADSPGQYYHAAIKDIYG
jgi:lysyl-tRNA synthetase class 2